MSVDGNPNRWPWPKLMPQSSRNWAERSSSTISAMVVMPRSTQSCAMAFKKAMLFSVSMAPFT